MNALQLERTAGIDSTSGRERMVLTGGTRQSVSPDRHYNSEKYYAYNIHFVCLKFQVAGLDNWWVTRSDRLASEEDEAGDCAAASSPTPALANAEE